MSKKVKSELKTIFEVTGQLSVNDNILKSGVITVDAGEDGVIDLSRHLLDVNNEFVKISIVSSEDLDLPLFEEEQEKEEE